jgi:Tfp pilus assembly protein FimT
MKLRNRLAGTVGFSVIEMVVGAAIVATVAAISVPAAVNMISASRLGMSMRDVERELQFAKLKAVATNRPMRIRFNCPSTGKFRAVEVIGTTGKPDSNDADSIAGRCDETTYPYSPTGADKNRLTRPNNDGPMRYLQSDVSFTSSKTLEFWPDGTVHADTGVGSPWPVLGSTGQTITLTRKGVSKNLKVNALGKIQMDR